MKILVIGGGGREHALAWKLAQSERVQRVYVAPGNGGTAADRRLVNVAVTDPQALADFAVAEKDRLYRCLDRILEHREELFQHLQQRWKLLFDAQFDVLLYD